MEPPYGAVTLVDDLRSLEMRPLDESAAAIYDGPVGIRALHAEAEGGEEHYLVRYPPGTRCRLHRHSVAHTIVVLEGRLEANGRVVGPGAYAHFPAGQAMRHQPAGGEACLLVVLFHGPFDARLAEP